MPCITCFIETRVAFETVYIFLITRMIMTWERLVRSSKNSSPNIEPTFLRGGECAVGQSSVPLANHLLRSKKAGDCFAG